MDNQYLTRLEEENQALKADNAEKDDKIFKLSFDYMELEKVFKEYRYKMEAGEHDEDYRKWRKQVDDEIDESLRRLSR